jgi:hypothetical protein
MAEFPNQNNSKKVEMLESKIKTEKKMSQEAWKELEIKNLENMEKYRQAKGGITASFERLSPEEQKMKEEERNTKEENIESDYEKLRKATWELTKQEADQRVVGLINYLQRQVQFYKDQLTEYSSIPSNNHIRQAKVEYQLLLNSYEFLLLKIASLQEKETYSSADIIQESSRYLAYLYQKKEFGSRNIIIKNTDQIRKHIGNVFDCTLNPLKSLNASSGLDNIEPTKLDFDPKYKIVQENPNMQDS